MRPTPDDLALVGRLHDEIDEMFAELRPWQRRMNVTLGLVWAFAIAAWLGPDWFAYACFAAFGSFVVFVAIVGVRLHRINKVLKVTGALLNPKAPS